MGIDVEVSGQSCGALIHGVNFKEELSPSQIKEIRGIWLEHLVVGFPDQDLNCEQLERVALHFGVFGEDPYLEGLAAHPHIAEIRREADETSSLFADNFHSDWSFLPVPPVATLLYGIDIPPVGGDTLFANQQMAYEALDAETKARISTLKGVHSARLGYAPTGRYGEGDEGRSMAIVYSEEAMATYSHPLVLTHPETGRKGLFLSGAYTIGIDPQSYGQSNLSEEEARELLISLFRHQAREEFVYRHRWSPGMLTMWDNRSVLHAATGGYEGHRRLLQRITIAPFDHDQLVTA
jgi:taurine dioxygenase